jgi:uncharacterized protein (TIGR00369 family)
MVSGSDGSEQGGTQRPDLKTVDESRPTTLKTFGAKIMEMQGSGLARLRYRFDPGWCNPRGSIQGGMFCVFFDEAMSYAIVALEGEKPPRPFSTLSLSTTFIRPVVGGEFDAVGRVVRAGRTVVHVEGEIVQDDKLIARAGASAIYI